jgi:hypothetical protein
MFGVKPAIVSRAPGRLPHGHDRPWATDHGVTGHEATGHGVTDHEATDRGVAPARREDAGVLVALLVMVGVAALAAVPIAGRAGLFATTADRARIVAALGLVALAVAFGTRWWSQRAADRHADHVAAELAEALADIDGASVDVGDPPRLTVDGTIRWARLGDTTTGPVVVEVRLRRGTAQRCLVTVLGAPGDHRTAVGGRCRLPDLTPRG